MQLQTECFPCSLKSKNYFATNRRLRNILLLCILGISILCLSPFPMNVLISRRTIDTDIPLIQDFQKIGIGPDKLYVYSAYFDEYRGAGPGSIRILGGIKTNFPRPLYCQFYDEDGHHYSTIQANVSAIVENWGYRYSASFIICKLNDYFQMPVFVSVVESFEKGQKITNVLRINYQEKRNLNERKYKFSACVQPTFDYDDPLQFLEWMEFYRLMGVEKFTFYNKSIGVQTSCLMKSYGEEIEVLPWSSPYEPEKEIRVHSQFIGANDCIYRYRGITKYLVIVDLDEMIVPRQGNNYANFFHGLEHQVKVLQNFTGYISSFNFRNGFFFSSWPDDVDSTLPFIDTSISFTANKILKQLKINRKTMRAPLESHNDRSKFVAIPENVVEIGAHMVYEASGNAFTIDVPEELAYSHHYRKCLWDYCETKNKTKENSGSRFAKDVAVRIEKRLAKAANCNVEFPAEY